MVLQKTLLLSLFFATSLNASPDFLKNWLPQHTPGHFHKLMAKEEYKAWRARLVIGFVGGFCANAFCAKLTKANIAGMPSTAACTYLVKHYAPILNQSREWADVAMAYAVGLLAGRIARKTYEKISEKFDTIFNKPEARVVLTKPE